MVRRVYINKLDTLPAVYRKTYIDSNKLPKSPEINRIPVRDHPLKSVTVTDRLPRRILGSQPSTGRTTPVTTPSSILEPLTLALQVLDPLTEFSVREEMDPLSKMAAEMVNSLFTA